MRDRTTDRRFMRRALALALRGRGTTAPNPMVGAVVVRDGRIVGEGFTQPFGGAHAEVQALLAAGGNARGATVYATLEPCANHGKTPPCSARLIEAGVSRVVYAAADPNPAMRGGADQLCAAGVASPAPMSSATVVIVSQKAMRHCRNGRHAAANASTSVARPTYVGASRPS